MSKQTINIGASPNDGTGTPLRTSFDYTNQNFTELYTAVGPSGNNIVVPGNATITGDLTVDTNVLKVDTTNNRVGIGTASPTGIFHAANLGTAGTTADNFNGYFSSANRNSNVYILAKNTEGSNLYFGDGDSNTVGAVIYDHTSNYMRFDTNGSERMRIDSSGNVGIGVTPSAWGSNYTAVELTKGACIWGAKNVPYTNVGANVYNDVTNEKYVVSASTAATKYLQASGIHYWYNAPAGTAGNTITFTQAMTLDASGNLLLGTVTSPTGTKIGSISKLGSVCVEGSNAISVSTTPVALARIIGTGGLFFVTGYNTSGGNQGWWLVASTGGGTPTVIASGNNTGLTVAFTTVVGIVYMNTVSGTLSVTSFAITNQL